MTDIPKACALIPHSKKVAGAILYIALAPSNFLYLQRYTHRPKRYNGVTQRYIPRVKTLQTTESVTGLSYQTAQS